MTQSGSETTQSPSQLIDGRNIGARRLAGRNAQPAPPLIKDADPEVVEEWEWRGVPVWSHDGILSRVKVTGML
jgi:hypothetical protein